MDLKSENSKLEKGRKNPDACCQNFAATYDALWVFRILNSEEHKSVSGQQTDKLVSLSLEAILGTKNQNKKIQGSCYRGNITQKSKKNSSKSVWKSRYVLDVSTFTKIKVKL